MAKKSVPVCVFGVEFESISEFKRASGLRQAKAGLDLEDLIHRSRVYRYKTDAEIAQILRCSRDKGGHRLVQPVLELLKGGLKYQLDCKAIPKDDVYFLAKRLYDAPDFKEALRMLLHARTSRYTGMMGISKAQRHGLKGDKQRYNRDRVGQPY